MTGDPSLDDLVTTPEYWTCEEVATYLRLSTKSIYRLIATDPTLPVLRFGHTRRFPRMELLAWLDERTRGES